MAYDARAIANVILTKAKTKRLYVTNMALNKILYFSHGWYLATEGQPLVNYQFEAWEHGPVLPTIYHQFKRFGDKPITGLALMIDLETGRDIVATCALPTPDAEFLDRMVSFYGYRNAIMLSMMSHEADAPWAQTRNTNPKPGMVISDDSIREYFSAKLATGGRARDVH